MIANLLNLSGPMVSEKPEHICANCKHFPGEGQVCPKSKMVVFENYRCYSSHYRVQIKILKSDDEFIVENHNRAAVAVMGSKIVLVTAEPVFSFEPKEVEPKEAEQR